MAGIREFGDLFAKGPLSWRLCGCHKDDPQHTIKVICNAVNWETVLGLRRSRRTAAQTLCSLLGSFLLKWQTRAVQAINSPRLQALLACLLLNRDKPLSRRQVAFQFWPDTSDAQAFANLRTLLTLLRRTLPEADRFMHAGRRTLQWQSEAPFRLDVADFERALAAGELEQAVNVYGGDLLPDCYDDWIQPERERLRQDFGRALEKVIQACEAARDYEAAICYAQTYLQHDPLRESTYGHLMRLHALRGSRSQVARIFQECTLTLKRELGVEPSAATRKVYEQFLQLSQRPPRVCGGHNNLPLVGRDREWQYLLARWREAAAGNPGMTLLLGEAGIGKTRLLEECHEWAYRQGITAAYARCYATQGRLAYAPVTGWLRCPQIKGTLGSLERVWLEEIARLLPELSLELADATPPAPITEGWQRLRLFEALARAVFTAPQPRLLILDDLQWADRETVAWLSFLMRFDTQAELLLLALADRPFRFPAMAVSLDGRWLTVLLNNREKYAAAYFYDLIGGRGREFQLYPSLFDVRGLNNWSADEQWLARLHPNGLILMAPVAGYQYLAPHNLSGCVAVAWVNTH
jgi:DNA-binding SARP family transcriptional activator